MRLTGWILIQPANQLNQKGNLYSQSRILVLGESTSADHFAIPDPGPWPRQLQKELRAEGYDVSVFNMALGGVTSSILLGRLAEQLAIYRPNMVIAMMGTNDHLYSRYMHESGFRGWLYRLRVVRAIQLVWRNYQKWQYPEVISSDLANYGKWWGENEEPRFIRDVVAEKIRQHGLEWVEREASRFSSCSQAATLASVGLYLWGDFSQKVLSEKMAHYFEKAFRLCPQSSFTQFWYLVAMSKSQSPERCREGSSAIFKYGINLADDVFESLVLCWESSYPKQLLKIARLKNIELVDGDYRISHSPYGGAHSYLDLYSMLKPQGIPLVAMQYPTLAISRIRDLFPPDERSQPEKLSGLKSVYFVENRENFVDALRKYSYEEIFADRFKQSWGHTTPLGHHLIAIQLMPTLHQILRAQGIRPQRP